LTLRHGDEAFSAQDSDTLHGALLGPRAFLLRAFHASGHRLIVVNLGDDLTLDPAPEPLLAARPGRRWRLLIDSEDVRYGGKGYAEPERDGVWQLTAHSACVFREEET
jgi:maltooligosyltrehalose trehalohydrolase